VLVSKTLIEEMKKVLDDAAKMVNFIKQRPVQSRMFKKLCENLDKQHINPVAYQRKINRAFEL
jgi:hypothetical protein